MSKTPQTRTFQSYSDPSHGWVKVSHKLLAELGIADKISTYSYSRGEHAYLEEDLDLNTFHNSMLARGITPLYDCHSSNRTSRIRGYNHYSRPPIAAPCPDSVACPNWTG